MPKFTLEGNRLVVEGPLDSNDEEALRIHCQDLQATEADMLVVDMTAVDAVSSGCLGILVGMLYHQAKRSKKMQVLASKNVQKILELTGVTTVLAQVSEDSDE